MNKIENYINGNIVSVSNKTQLVHDPSTGEEIGAVILSNDQDFNNAIQSSKKAQLKPYPFNQ